MLAAPRQSPVELQPFAWLLTIAGDDATAKVVAQPRRWLRSVPHL